ncbi:FtsX-like permease family protein [Nocardioides antri]|uniref:FtsX-like permease family protein n=1 Tax=Nocardioides antri TaxID=2607659 RepID=A0A5B1M9D0_9ACTN|nr:FtsX-like permease family protein [Nocardioides antri]KAA1429244.1 FtsX-like permease family protein [Nocardioides antri]
MIRVALDGLRSRALLSAGTLALLVIAVASAVVGPAFTVAVGNSYAISRLSEAPNPITGRTWEFRPTGSPGPGDALAAARDAVQVPSSQRDLSLQLETDRVPAPGAYGEVQLLARDGACEHLEIEGRCPQRPGETAILAGDAEEDGLRIGDRLELGDPLGELTVVGTYVYPNGQGVDDDELAAVEDFWFDPARLASVPAQVLGTQLLPRRPAPYLVPAEQFASVPARLFLVRADTRIDVPADLDAGQLSGLAAEDPGSETLDSGTLTEVSLNDLDAVTAEVEQEREAAVSSVTPAVVSLVLVALALLSRLTSAAGDLRVPDLALASLRGASRRRVWLLALGEPLLLVVIALPLGVLAGVGLTQWLVRSWLAPGLPLPLPPVAGLTVLAVTAAAVGVCALAVRGVLTRTLADQLTGHQRPRKAGRSAVLGILVLVAATLVVATLALTRTGGATDASDLVLPVLVAATFGGAATAGARAGAARLAARRPRGTVVFLAVRAVARRAAGTLVVLPLTVAIAVCTFGAGVYDAAATWRESVAATQAPADTVWATELPMEEAVALTHALDPDGRWLMAAGTFVAQDAIYVAVDGARLGQVATWHETWTPGRDVNEIAAVLTGTALPAVTGSRLGLTMTVPRGSEPVTVEVRFRDAKGAVSGAYVGPFAAGTSSLTERVACRTTCTIEGLLIGGGAGLPTELDGTFVLGPMEMDGADRTDVLTDGGWQLTSAEELQQVAGEVTTTSAGLTVRATGRGLAGLTAGDVPPVRPVVAGREIVDVAGDVPGGAATSRAGQPPPITAAVVAESVPFLGPRGVAIDHTMMSVNRSIFSSEFDTRVLATSDTPQRIDDALAARGLVVATTQDREVERLDGTAYAIVLRLYLVSAALVLLMAVAGLAVSTAVQLPGRRLDAASLSVVGVRRRSVLLAVALEQGVVLGAAGVAGLAAGSLTQWIVLRRITLGVVEGVSWPRVVAHVDPTLLSIVATGVAVLLGCVAVVSAWLTVRRARGASLREKAG